MRIPWRVHIGTICIIPVYNSQVDWHWHNEFEIVAVSEGVVDCHVGQESFRLKAGEAVFINSRVLHQFTAKDYGIMPNIVFSPEFIAPEQTVIYDKFIAPIEKSTMAVVKILCIPFTRSYIIFLFVRR